MLDYKNFKQDCKIIIEPFIEKYGFHMNFDKSEDYINYYSNNEVLIEVSMLENFPYIGVSLDFLTFNGKKIRRSILNQFLQISLKEESNSFNDFFLDKNVNDYSNQMRYSVFTMEKFYKPILTGEVRLEDVIGKGSA